MAVTRSLPGWLLFGLLLAASMIAGCRPPRDLLRTAVMAHHVNRGYSHLVKGRCAESSRELERALRLHPQDEIRLLLAQAYVDCGRYKQALHQLQAISDREIHNFAYYTMLGTCFDELGKLDEAEAAYRQAIVVDPNNPWGYNNLGYFFANRNLKLTEAEWLLRRAVEALPNDGMILDSLGWLFYRQGKLREARRLLRKAVLRSERNPLRANPDSAEIHYHLGVVEKDLGHREAARRELMTALRLDPDIEQAAIELRDLGVRSVPRGRGGWRDRIEEFRLRLERKWEWNRPQKKPVPRSPDQPMVET